MKVQAAARQQLQFWHGVSDGVMSTCGDALNKQLADATISSPASVYAHAVFSEDAIVNGMLQGKPPLFQSGGWEAKTGVAFPGEQPSLGEWAKDFRMDYPKFKAYADAVFAQTDAYIGGLSDSDLDEKKPTPIGEQSLGWVITSLLGTHMPQHVGEIAALKGVQGLKGLPF